MPEIFVNEGWQDSVKHPESQQVQYNHPKTGKPGHYLVRRGTPREVWDRQKQRMVVVVPTEVEELTGPGDGENVFILGDGFWSDQDFKEIEEELAESRGSRRRNRPTMAPPAALIEEACREIELRGAEEYTNPDTGHTWVRPSKGLLLPRNAEWAHQLAELSKRDWRTGRSVV